MNRLGIPQRLPARDTSTASQSAPPRLAQPRSSSHPLQKTAPLPPSFVSASSPATHSAAIAHRACLPAGCRRSSARHGRSRCGSSARPLLQADRRMRQLKSMNGLPPFFSAGRCARSHHRIIGRLEGQFVDDDDRQRIAGMSTPSQKLWLPSIRRCRLSGNAPAVRSSARRPAPARDSPSHGT